MENLEKTGGKTENHETADYYGQIITEYNKHKGYDQLQKNRPEAVEKIAQQIVKDLENPQKKNAAYNGLKELVDRILMH